MDLILHLGAHRTGSTALIRCLHKNDALLQRRGVALWPPETLRHLPRFGAVPELVVQAAAGAAPAEERLAHLRRALTAEADRLEVTGCKRLILSEENLIGSMQANLSGGGLYHDLGQRLAAYAAILPRAPAVIALGLRDYASLWPSAYVYVLPRRLLPPFADIAQALCSMPRGWPEVVADIRAVFPGAQILLWRHDMFRDRMTRVVAVLAGTGTADGINPVRRDVNPARFRQSVDLIHRLRRDDPTLAGIALAARIAEAGPDARGEAPAFTPAQAAMLEARYRHDIGVLYAEPGAVLFADAD
jgi:hypothetical protein